jgi:hypothetical protein
VFELGHQLPELRLPSGIGRLVKAGWVMLESDELNRRYMGHLEFLGFVRVLLFESAIFEDSFRAVLTMVFGKSGKIVA